MRDAQGARIGASALSALLNEWPESDALLGRSSANRRSPRPHGRGT